MGKQIESETPAALLFLLLVDNRHAPRSLHTVTCMLIWGAPLPSHASLHICNCYFKTALV